MVESLFNKTLRDEKNANMIELMNNTIEELTKTYLE